MTGLRILMAAPFPRDPEIIRGGIEGVSAVLAPALARIPDIDLHLAGFHPSVTRPHVEHQGNLTIHWQPRPRRFSTLHTLTIAAARLAHLERRLQPDVLHVQSPSALSVAALTSRRPLVVTIHGLEPFGSEAVRTRLYAGAFGLIRLMTARLVSQAALVRGNAFISISPYVDQVLSARIGGRPIAHIENPVHGPFFEVSLDRIEPILLSVGNLSRLKNPLALVRSFQPVAWQHPEWRLVIAGPATDVHYRQELQLAIRELRLETSVHLFGNASLPQLVTLYERAAALLVGSIQETAPVAIAQAMAAGRPVVATDVGGNRWMVRNGETGFLVPLGIDGAMSRAIQSLVGDSKSRERMGICAREEAKRRFHPDQVARQTIQVYDTLLSAPHPRL